MRQLIVDLRCLQDHHHVERGIGNHARSILAQAPGPVIGIIDPHLPLPAPDIIARTSALHAHGYVPVDDAVFLNLSPMSANQARLARLLTSPHIIKTSLVYDFIPHDEPERYLSHMPTRLDYRCSLTWLRKYDHFFPISEDTAGRLHQLYGNVPATITGVALPAWATGITPQAPRHILMVGGDDDRKNTGVLARAHAASAVLRQIPLVVTGRTTGLQYAQLRNAILPGRVTTDIMRELYAHALCVVVPSRAEGFSMPIIEGAAAAVPVLASDIPAHSALLTDPAHRFGVDDDARLTALLETLIASPAARQAVVDAQRGLTARFTAAQVGARVYDALPLCSPAPQRGARPRLAVLTPLPPSHSGVADYSAAMIAALRRRIDVEVFPTMQGAMTAHVHPRFDRVLSVIGNSHMHGFIDDLAQRWGSAVLCHDARLMGLASRHGLESSAQQASHELGMQVSAADIMAWTADERLRRASFLGPLARAARPIIFHSPQPAARARTRFGADARHLPFAIYRAFPTTITPAMRARARARLGFDDDVKYILSFGIVHPIKGITTALTAFARLRRTLGARHGTRRTTKLIFAGPANDDYAPMIAALGLTGHVTFTARYLTEATYRDYLLAADAGLQLREGGDGNISGALQDCITAGLPAVANADLADNLAAPDYVTRTENELRADDIAGALEQAMAPPCDTEAARQSYVRTHHMDRYAASLADMLGL
jgi:glycosyltransferase involved in cell wall biosynthesis